MKSALLLLALVLLACKSEPNESKNMPRLPPPPEANLPADLAIHVTRDGKTLRTIDAATLQKTPPDFADDERRAWKLTTLLGALDDVSSVNASGSADAQVVLDPHAKDGKVAVVMISRRGDVIATMVDAAHPFPTFHGQGGRLGRPGDTQPRALKLHELALIGRAQ